MTTAKLPYSWNTHSEALGLHIGFDTSAIKYILWTYPPRKKQTKNEKSITELKLEKQFILHHIFFHDSIHMPTTCIQPFLITQYLPVLISFYACYIIHVGDCLGY